MLLAASIGRAADVHADGYRVTIWTTADGLPENDVTAVFRCDDGQLLIGTKNHGLATFNGMAFRPVRLQPNVSPRVHRIVNTSEGTPIVSFLGGVIGAYRDGGIVVEYRPQKDAERVRWLLERQLEGGSDGDWFETYDSSTVRRIVGPESVTWRLPTVEERPAGVQRHEQPATPEHMPVSDRRGGSWLVTDVELRHESADGAIASFGTERLGFDVAAVQCLTADDEGNLWVGLKRQGLARIRATLFRSPPLAAGGSTQGPSRCARIDREQSG